jgi:hypothetical protein
MPGFNPSSEPYAFAAGILDAAGSGIAITVAAAGTPADLKGAGFAEIVNNSAGGLVWVPADGTLTVAKEQAAGLYEIEVAPGNTIGNNAGVKIFQLVKGTTKIGNHSRAVEPATAVQSGMATVKAIVALVKGDVVKVQNDVGTNGHAVTTRELMLTARKIG